MRPVGVPGTLLASIGSDGALSGGYTATGTNGGQITGSLSGATDNQRACGSWENTAGQSGTWQLLRTGSSPVGDAGVSGTPQPATFLCQPRPDTCAAGTRCWFSCTGTPSFQCTTGSIGAVEYGGACNGDECVAGSVCTHFSLPDGATPRQASVSPTATWIQTARLESIAARLCTAARPATNSPSTSAQ